MPRVILDGTPVKRLYEPPEAPQRNADFSGDIVQAIVAGLKEAIASMPAPVVRVEAPVVNVPKPEIKINSPVYVQPPEIKIPAATVNVPEGKAPVVNVEPPTVTLQTNRPNKWKFTFNRDEYGRLITAICEDISGK